MDRLDRSGSGGCHEGLEIGGGYRLTKRIGSSGFGEIWRAEGPGAVQVAVKALFRPLDTGEAKRELKARELVKNLRHAYLVQTHAYWALEDRLYIVMELADSSLRDRLQQCVQSGLPGIPLPEILQYFREVAEALDYLHAKKVLHRDIKPDSILLQGGHAKLGGFGLARIHSHTQLSTMASGSGTPSYMAPEIWRGKANFHSDQYALAMSYAEMRLGRRVVGNRDMAAIMFEHLEGKPDLTPLGPAEQQVLLKALAKEPDQRFPTCSTFVDALAVALASGSAHSGPQPSEVPTTVLPSSPSSVVPPVVVEAGGFFGDPTAALPSPPYSAVVPRAESGEPPALPPLVVGNYVGGWFGSFLGVVGAALDRITGKSTAPPTTPARPRTELSRPITDQVRLALTAPPTVKPGNAYVVDAWVYLASQAQEVLARARQAQGCKDIVIRPKSGVAVTRGALLTVRLSLPDFVVPDPEDVLRWDGEIGNATFPVSVPRERTPGRYPGIVTFFENGLQIAKLHFTLEVGQRDAAPAWLPTREHRHRSAFASYANEDRDDVLARVQGMQKALPELDVFLDVVSLRSGQHWGERLVQEIRTRDVFYLFWSVHAKQSEWVEKEWRTALQYRGLDYIDPVPLASPEDVPPPPELAGHLHFNDWVLAYLRNRDRPAPV